MSSDLLEMRPVPPAPDFRPSRRFFFGALVAGLVGLALTIIGFIVEPQQAAFSWLSAYATGLSIALGALIFLQICWAMNASWPVAIRRLTEHIAATVPLFAIGFIPVLIGIRKLYPWVTPADIADPLARELVAKKLHWLNPGFFGARAGFYLLVWIGTSLLLRFWSLRQDGSLEAGPVLRGESRASRALSAGLLPAVGLTMSFASFDWLMSLLPSWFSTMFGVYWFAGGFVSALAVLTIVAAGAARLRLLALTRHHSYALGRLLFAFTVFWAYIGFFQYFIIWIADRPNEGSWYLLRMQNGWWLVSVLLGVLHFAVPFFALLSWRVKQSFAPLVVVSVWILFAHIIDGYWLVLPSLHATPHVSWLDATSLLTVGGLGTAFGAWLAGGHPLVPAGDPRLARALAYEAKS